MDVREIYHRADERRREAAIEAQLHPVPRPDLPPRTPLSAGQHILHLLLTVFTFGLWAPVWAIRAIQGNR